MPQDRAVQSVERAFRILDAIAAVGGTASVTEIAARTDLPDSTTHRLLTTLVTLDVLQRLPARRYGLTHRLVHLGAAATPHIAETVRPVLAALVENLGETANLALLIGDQAEYVAQVPSHHAMRMFTEVGRKVELHCTGVGKAILAALEPSDRDRLLASLSLPPKTAYTLTSVPELLAELERAGRDGFALDEQEQELGVRCIATAFTTETGATFAVSVSGPTGRMSDELIERAAPELAASAAELATLLGPVSR